MAGKASFEWDTAGLALVLETMAESMHDLGEEAAGIAFNLAPSSRGIYRRSIGVTTYAGGKRVRGRALKNIVQMGRADVLTVVYSSSSLAHLLERGTRDRWVGPRKAKAMVFTTKSGDDVITSKPVHQPAMPRRPHFGPAAVQAAARFPQVFAARFAPRMR